MEYQRKERWANYGTPKCKIYLRNDFSHECAYCRLQEKEIAIIDQTYFEIDHFRPQSDDNPSFNPHIYTNLFYSCTKCNSEKSDIWDEKLLNPCEDDIFVGDSPAIKGGYSEDTLYKYVAQNEKGQFYIDTFKLNSRYHIRIRQSRIEKQSKIREIDMLIEEILHKIYNKRENEQLKNIVEMLDSLRKEKIEELSLLSSDEIFMEAQRYLGERNVDSSIIFEEYNMDIKIKINNVSYYCELVIDKDMNDKEQRQKYISTEKLRTWLEKVSNPFGILYFYPKINKMYFYPVSSIISKKDILKLGEKKRIVLTKNDLI